MQDQNTQHAFVLQARPYRETSLLIDFLTENAGRVSAIAKGVRSKKSTWKALLQPFIHLKIDYIGKRDLMTLTLAEQASTLTQLSGRALYCGFYMNELLTRVLHRHDPSNSIYQLYLNTLQTLNQHDELSLRQFELALLKELGYELHFECHAQPLQPNELYHYFPQRGFVMAESDAIRYKGHHLIAISKNQLDSEEVLKTAKQLMRQALRPHLGDKPLKSRDLVGFQLSR